VVLLTYLRFGEDIDLVQVRPERIGPTIDAIREALAWLGDFHRDRAGHSIHHFPVLSRNCARHGAELEGRDQHTRARVPSIQFGNERLAAIDHRRS
jgi:hypothetical protein